MEMPAVFAAAFFMMRSCSLGDVATPARADHLFEQLRNLVVGIQSALVRPLISLVAADIVDRPELGRARRRNRRLRNLGRQHLAFVRLPDPVAYDGCSGVLT